MPFPHPFLPSRALAKLALPPVALAVACSLGGPRSSGQSGDPGDSALLGECQGSSWPSYEDSFRSGSCEAKQGSQDVFVCECDDKSEEVEADFCGEALLEVCEIDLAEPDHCTRKGYGACWPTDDGEYRCLCDGPDEQWREGEGDSCSDALTALCVDDCEGFSGICRAPIGLAATAEAEAVSSTGDAPTQLSSDYQCNCRSGSHSSETFERVTTGASSALCERALEAQCGETCQLETGHCEATEEGFDCTCSDGTKVAVDELDDPLDYFEVGMEPGCYGALERSCGQLAAAISCESKNESVTGRCTSGAFILFPGETRPEEAVFSCECAQGSEVKADTYQGTCKEALTATCPESLRTDAQSPLAIGDFGQLCEKDDDCELGACYVPGTRQDAICSQLCDSTDDCPEGTLCAFDHCFIACNGDDDDDDCLYLNGAIDNPLQCFNLSPGFGQGHICIQESEP